MSSSSQPWPRRLKTSVSVHETGGRPCETWVWRTCTVASTVGALNTPPISREVTPSNMLLNKSPSIQ
ncbi:MAG TPA: hypothetical protein DIT13_19780 [Verrucomicrobiales bacterium]|nr:hypothetical protein [Verrucomicrobiales bacterium]